jgi:hypothetical protein
LVRNPEGKRPLEGSKRKWKDTVKMDLKDMGWEGVNWIHLAQDRDRLRALVNRIINE